MDIQKGFACLIVKMAHEKKVKPFLLLFIWNKNRLICNA